MKHFSKGGTHIRDDQAAFIVNPDGSFHLVIPDTPAGQDLPRNQLLIVALALKLEVPGWYDSMIEEVLQFASDNQEVLADDASKH